MPPRTLNFAVRRRKRGASGGDSASAISLVTASWKAPRSRNEPDVKLQRLELHAQPIRNVFEDQSGEVRLSGLRTQAGELRDAHANRVVALRSRIGEGLKSCCGVCSHARLLYTTSCTQRRHARSHGHEIFEMRLTKIKLAGFKSFVDPTSVGFPSNLTGVVGPNGCGKSNIIDAVRWVMGELSARHLRGDSMADVVFNGSSARKPVGTASVELVFDNSRRQDRRRVRQLQRGVAQAPGLARRQLELFHQRRALPPQGHHAAVSRHGLGLAQLRDHRAGHDLARHRGQARGHARLHRGGGRHLPLQGASPRDREPHRRDAREPRAAAGRARRGRQADPPSAAPGRKRAALSGAEGAGAPR